MKAVFEKNDKFGFKIKHTEGFIGFPPMFHHHCEIILIVRGEINMTVDTHSFTLKEGEISVVFPYVVHSYEDSPDAEFYVLLFEPETVGIFECELLQKKPACPRLSDCAHLAPLFDKIIDYKHKSDTAALRTAVSYISAVVGELICALPLYATDTTAEDMIKPILFYCADHFTDEDISIKKVADDLFISTSYVSKIFSVKLKYGFREYINELRISKARKLLSSTDNRIVDIMLDCGFKNQSSFNRVFSENCGMSPREYRTRFSIK